MERVERIAHALAEHYDPYLYRDWLQVGSWTEINDQSKDVYLKVAQHIADQVDITDLEEELVRVTAGHEPSHAFASLADTYLNAAKAYQFWCKRFAKALRRTADTNASYKQILAEYDAWVQPPLADTNDQEG